MDKKYKKLEDIELRSEDIQEILTKVPHWLISYGNALFLLLIFMVLSLSYWVKYPDVINAEASIITAVPAQKVHAKSSGRIVELLVENNEIIAPKSALAVVENSSNFKDVYLLKSILDTISLNSSSFYFPIEELPIFTLGEIESSYALFENSYLEYLIFKELQPLTNDANSNQYTLNELRARLAIMEYQKELAQSELNYKKKELERNKQLFDEGVIAEQEYENTNLTYVQTERSFENMRISISQLHEAIRNAQKNARTIEISKKEKELTSLRKVIQSYNQLQKSIREWELKYVLRSDIKGTVAFLDNWTENHSINQGDLVFTIIPVENTAFLARLKSPARNAGKMQIGQTVNINLEDYPNEEFGVLKSTISHISSMPNSDGEYMVDAELPEKLITTYKRPIEFRQEMKGTAEIVTDDLRLIDRFLGRIKQIFN